jgi:hypothetical protein
MVSWGSKEVESKESMVGPYERLSKRKFTSDYCRRGSWKRQSSRIIELQQVPQGAVNNIQRAYPDDLIMSDVRDYLEDV